MELVQEIYRLTKTFPKREWYGVTAQMRRAAISIPANIAEGRGRFTSGEFVRFLRIAMGSLRELETYSELSLRLQYATIDQIQVLTSRTDEVGSMLAGLMKSLQRKSTSPRE